jgi:hypothetical protein
MITSAQIARFRGIRELVVEGLGRVNLIIGRNDCGKTAFMEALEIAEDAPDAAHLLRAIQRRRLGRNVQRHDFDRFWRPLFYNLDAKRGFTISAADGRGRQSVLEVRQGPTPDEIISNGEDLDLVEEDGSSVERPSWSIDLHLRTDKEAPKQRIVATSQKIKLPPVSTGSGSSWITSGVNIGSNDIRYVSELKQTGRDSTLLELLREIDGRLSGIELLAPSGSMAELFVRLDKNTPLLPVGLMGEGFQRCLELGAAVVADDWPTMFIDEIENGMHYLALEPLWRWIGTISRERNLQIFATTHSEECIYAACRAFAGLADEGLRVLRLDRLDQETRVAMYDRTLIQTAERTGTEIRG